MKAETCPRKISLYCECILLVSTILEKNNYQFENNHKLHDRKWQTIVEKTQNSTQCHGMRARIETGEFSIKTRDIP